MPHMPLVFALTRHTGERLAELGCLFIVIAGVWLALAQIPPFSRLGAARVAVAGVALAIGGVLLIIAIHWGYFGAFF